MDVEKIYTNTEKPIDNDNIDLPGFRFHPTDEELVGFYLRRKVEMKPLRWELIKQADIYKFDPWDLPKSSINTGDKELYFFCKRGRKYKNSTRPNRVTSSGFWKATGIDRTIYSSSGYIIGLKKSLVYYHGSAGKGTKTEWMMHEFRLPPDQTEENSIAQDAEVWTLCRILNRNASHGKCSSQWKVSSSSFKHEIDPPSDRINPETGSIGFGSDNHNIKPVKAFKPSYKAPLLNHCLSSPMVIPQTLTTTMPSSLCMHDDTGDLQEYRDWEDLYSIVNSASLDFYH